MSAGESKGKFRPHVALVTGASGFIGSHVVRVLLDKGVQVRALIKRGDPLHNLYGLDVERIEGDLLDEPSLLPALQGCDSVFHLAAVFAYWLPDPSVMYRVNIHGTRMLLQAAQRAGVKRAVYTSSIAAVGTSEGKTLADENTIFNDWLTADHYVMSKYMAELEALSMNQRGLCVIAVNPCFPFGDGDIAPTPTGELVARYVSGKTPVWLPGGFNVVHVRDVAEGHWLAATQGKPGERYILGGHNITYKEFATRVCNLAGVSLPKYELSPRILSGMGKVNEWISDHITKHRPVFVDKGVRYTAGRYLWLDIAKAIRELGYSPRPLEDALRDAVTWFRHGRQERMAQMDPHEKYTRVHPIQNRKPRAAALGA